MRKGAEKREKSRTVCNFRQINLLSIETTGERKNVHDYLEESSPKGVEVQDHENN